MKNPTLADFAAAYVENFIAGSEGEKKHLSTLLFTLANELAPNHDFVALAGRSGMTTHGAALAESKGRVMEAVSCSNWEVAGANACIHLMLLNSFGSLEDAPAAKAAAEAAAKMYAFELAENRFSMDAEDARNRSGGSLDDY